MSKIVLLASILSASLVATAVPGYARQISVWGNTFTTDEAPSFAPNASSGPGFRATVEQPERFLRGGRRHIELDR